MDDLTRIKGVGPATAARLVELGVDSFARLAAETPEGLVDKLGPHLRNPAAARGWIAEAGQLAAVQSHPPTPNEDSKDSRSESNEGQRPGESTAGTRGDGVASRSSEGGGALALLLHDERAAYGDALVDGLVEAYRAIAAARFTIESAQTDADRASARPHLDAAHARLDEATAAVRRRVELHVQSMHEGAGRPVETNLDSGSEMIRVRVTGPKKGRWRAGRQWGSVPADATVSAAELTALRGDPSLAVEVLD